MQYTRLGRFWQVPNSKLRIGTAAPLFYRISTHKCRSSQELQIPDSQSRIGGEPKPAPEIVEPPKPTICSCSAYL